MERNSDMLPLDGARSTQLTSSDTKDFVQTETFPPL